MKSSGWARLRATPYGIGPALLLGGIGFFQLFETSAFTAAGPEIVQDLGGNLSSVVFLLGVVHTAGVFASLGVGWLADRTRRVTILGVGTLLSGALGIFTSRAGSMFHIGSLRLPNDAATIAGQVPQGSLLADYYPVEDRGKVFAVLGMVAQLAAIGAPLMVALFVVNLGWRTTFVILGIPVVLLGATALIVLREPIRGYMERRALGAGEEVAATEEEPKSFGEGWRTVWSVRTLKRLFLAEIWLQTARIPFQFFPFFLAERYGLGAFDRGLIFLPASLFGLAGGIVGGLIVDRLSQRNPARVLVWFALFDAVAALALAGLATQPPIPVVVGMVAIFGFGGALIGPAIGAVFSLVLPPAVRAQGSQMIVLAGLPASVVAFPVINQLLDRYGFSAVFVIAVPLYLIGAIVQLTAAGFFDVDRRSALLASMAAEEWRKARAAGKGKLLVCRGVDVSYDGVQVLFGVDFDVDDGEIVALLGTNGAGKSTLLRAISGVQEASGGAIVFDGRDITHMPPHESAGRGVVLMPGGRGVFPGLTVAENLLLAGGDGLAGVYDIFPVLRERSTERAGTLSGGEQQMLSLAQAFVTRPRLLMIDELSLGLAPAMVEQLLEAVRRIHERGTTVIVVEQSVNVALRVADRAVFMEKGEVRFFGPASELAERPDILRAVYVKGAASLGAGVKSAAKASPIDPKTARVVLECEGITRRFGGIVALDDVSFALREGEVLGIIGPNGAGKTTLFDVISGHQVPDAGTVLLDGADVTALGAAERARRKLVRRFQDARMTPSLTVLENILCALDQSLDVRSPFAGAVRTPRARRAERRVRQRAESLIELLDLGSYRDKFVRELSTGLRRIVDLACVLATQPRVLLLDEPSTGIAQSETENLPPLLRRVRFETGCSMLVIEHDMRFVSSIADELLALETGRVVTRGLPADVLDDERVAASYLGAPA